VKRAFSLYRSLSQLLRLPLAGPVFKVYAPRRRWDSVESEPQSVRVLIVNLMPSLGDTICYMATAEVLADSLPGVEITWLADSAMASLVARHPNVHRVITIHTPNSILKRVPTIKMYFRLYTLVRTLLTLSLPHRFTLAILPRGGVDPALSAHAVWTLNLPRSIGYSHLVEPEDIDHNFGESLLTDVVTHITTLHEAARALTLLERSGLVPDATQRWNADMPIRGLRAIAYSVPCEPLFARLGILVDAPFIVLSPVAGMPRKTWPASKFRFLCERILQQTGYTIVLTGTSAEANISAGIAAGLGKRVIDTAGRLNLMELISLLDRALAFVGNDSGTGHVAGALGRPVISLHVQPKTADPGHIHAPEHYRPVGPHVTIIQPDDFLAPCRGRCESTTVHCLNQIAVDQVWDALSRALDDCQDRPCG